MAMRLCLAQDFSRYIDYDAQIIAAVIAAIFGFTAGEELGKWRDRGFSLESRFRPS